MVEGGHHSPRAKLMPVGDRKTHAGADLPMLAMKRTELNAGGKIYDRVATFETAKASLSVNLDQWLDGWIWLEQKRKLISKPRRFLLVGPLVHHKTN